MKSYRHLYAHIYAWENLELAFRKARKGKRSLQPAADFKHKSIRIWKPMKINLTTSIIRILDAHGRTTGAAVGSCPWREGPLDGGAAA